MTSLLEIATAAGAKATVIPRKESWQLLQAWREVYCAPIYEAKGKWGRFAWETFSGHHFPALRGRRALNEYGAQPSTELLVLPDSDHVSAVRCTSNAAIYFPQVSLDLYVAPSSFEWTMVYTHEDPQFGPYFSRAAWRHGMT